MRAAITTIYLLTPISNHKESKYHTSQMGNMSNTITCSCQRREQFYSCITNNKILSLDWYRQREYKNTLIRINHTKSQQNGIDCTRSTYSSPLIKHSRTIMSNYSQIRKRQPWQLRRSYDIELHSLRSFLKKARSHTTCN